MDIHTHVQQKRDSVRLVNRSGVSALENGEILITKGSFVLWMFLPPLVRFSLVLSLFVDSACR